MADLQTLPGIGAGLAAELRAVGIRDAEALRAVGAEDAAVRLADLGLRDQERIRQILVDALEEQPYAAALPVLGIDNVAFTVGDLNAALEHYVAGMGLPVTLRRSEPPIVILRLGSGTPGLLLREDHTVPDAAPATRVPRLWLEVPDAAAAADILRARGLTPGRVTAVVAGRAVEIQDRWGNVVGLTDYSATPERARPVP